MQLKPLTPQWFAAEMKKVLLGRSLKSLGIAVSGGGDSVALAVLLANWAGDNGVSLRAITIDHGLRAESALEAQGVADLCARLNIPHQTRKWKGWSGGGNVSDAARNARKTLISSWALTENLDIVALGHTLDDQAETFLMRLARGSGVDGLSAMGALSEQGGVTWIRPLLAAHREDLRAFLRDQNVDWADDPTNEDDKYDRVKARSALKELLPLGIDVQGLAETATRLGKTRTYLETAACDLARSVVEITVTGDVVFAPEALQNMAGEMQFRLLGHALRWVASAPYRPRSAGINQVLAALINGTDTTLAGCRITVEKDASVRVFREYEAVKTLTAPSDGIWDNRWVLESGGENSGCHIAPLGENGLAFCPGWRDQQHPRNSLISAPALWNNDELIAAPTAGFGQEYSLVLKNGRQDFFSAMITH